MSINSPKSDTMLLIHNQSFGMYMAARVSSTLAFQMLAVAVGWQIYALTGSVFYLGLVGLAQFLPMFLLTLVVGHVADRYDRRWVVQICQLIQGLGTVFLAVGSYMNWLNKESILAIVFLLGAARSFEGPTTQALLPSLVSQEEFPRAVALSTASSQIASIIGPALGGLLYAAGSTIVYTTIGVLFLGASLLISRIQMNSVSAKREPVSLQSLFAGIVFIRSRPIILGAVSLDLFAVLLGGATALLPVYAKTILATGPWGLGLLRTAPAIGALLMSAVLTQKPLRHHVGRIMFTAVTIFGLATIIFAVSRSFVLSLITMIILGGADVISVVIRGSLVQLETPDEMRGRVSAVNSMFIGTSNQLGEFESGLTAAWLGAVPAVLIGGMGTIIVVILWIKLFPALAHADTLEQTIHA
ncbi:MAG TPA: MFS transporter [Firmicutes bacterium]|jgi:MFS family permease|nr:MFS transporter [Bacillota bacterium]